MLGELCFEFSTACIAGPSVRAVKDLGLRPLAC